MVMLLINFIENPSEELKLEAIKQYSYAIQFIENPSEELKLATVKQDGKAITYIKNPSEEVQLAAVKQTGHAIKYIKNPSSKLFTFELCLKYIDNGYYNRIPDEFTTPEIEAYALLKGVDM